MIISIFRSRSGIRGPRVVGSRHHDGILRFLAERPLNYVFINTYLGRETNDNVIRTKVSKGPGLAVSLRTHRTPAGKMRLGHTDDPAVKKLYHSLLVLFPGTGTRELAVLEKTNGHLNPVAKFKFERMTPLKDAARAIADIHKDVMALRKADLDTPKFDDLWRAYLAQDQLKANKGNLFLLEVGIILNALRLVNFKKVNADLRLLRKERRAQKDLKTFRAFDKHVRKIIAPSGIGAHNYGRPLDQRDPDDILKKMKNVVKIVEDRGYECFINSGTLLGQQRDGHFIGHDDDVDFGVYVGDGPIEEIKARWIALMADVESVTKITNKGRRPFFSIFPQGGPNVDFFPAWTHEGRAYVYPYCFGDVPSEALSPLKEVEWQGNTVFVPSDPEQILQANYGKNWRVPDPYWHFQWGKANSRFAGLMVDLPQTSGPT